MAEAILDLDVQPCCFEDAVQKVFKLSSIDVLEFIRGDDFQIG